MIRLPGFPSHSTPFAVALLLLAGCTQSGTLKPPLTSAADPADILTGKQVYLSDTTTAVTGTMKNLGALDLTAAFLGPGYVSSMTGLTPANVCSSSSLLGAGGTAVCLGGALTPAATASDLLPGQKAYAADGSVLTGTLSLTSPTQSAVAAGSENTDGVTTVVVMPPAGGLFAAFAVDLGAQFQKANICSGRTIFGRLGTAVCDSVFSDLMASNMHRNLATAQMTLSTEKSTSSYASGYREVAHIGTDDDGNPTAGGCANSGGVTDHCTTVVPATRASVICGVTGSVATRILDCADGAKNGIAATWTGASQAIGGESLWKLVTYTDVPHFEVWRDERTGLLWSENLPVGTYNWCVATGSSGAAPFAETDPAAYCSDALYQNQTSPTSACADTTGLFSPNGEDYAGTPSYVNNKGSLGSRSATPVRWRLPTRNDWLQADIDGLRFVLPHLTGRTYWASTISANSRDKAWVYTSSGTLSLDDRLGTHDVRCVGR